MINYIKSWRLLREQKSSQDYRFVVTKGVDEIKIHIIDKETEDMPEGKPNQYGERSGLAHMSLKKRGDNPFWEVASVSSPLNSTGVGKELYLLALELASTSGLSPDSIDISPMARGIWNTYLKAHPQIEVKEKETETDASEDDPYKYVFYIDARFESELDVEYKRMEGRTATGADIEPEPVPYDPETDVEDYLEDIYEDFQQDVKKKHSKLKFKMIGQGKNKYNVGGKLKKPSFKRSKSAPVSFGGS
tara:strand:+ start:2311 stop:3051 length:741 start_codon:yes stop_codon:yes gene_type:complete